MAIANVQGDSSKKYLFAGGQGCILYMYRIDLLLKCAPTLLCHLKTQHQTTLTGLIHFMLPDQSSYLATSSIDKCFGSYKVDMPKPRPMSPIKGAQMKSMMMGNRGQWGAQSAGTISQTTS